MINVPEEFMNFFEIYKSKIPATLSVTKSWLSFFLTTFSKRYSCPKKSWQLCTDTHGLFLDHHCLQEGDGHSTDSRKACHLILSKEAVQPLFSWDSRNSLFPPNSSWRKNTELHFKSSSTKKALEILEPTCLTAALLNFSRPLLNLPFLLHLHKFSLLRFLPRMRYLDQRRTCDKDKKCKVIPSDSITTIVNLPQKEACALVSCLRSLRE